VSAAPLAYYYGRSSPGENVKLYLRHVTALTTDLASKMLANPQARRSGTVVNTCGWVEGPGLALLQETLTLTQPDLVLVLNHDRLYADLQGLGSGLGRAVRVLSLPKSGGVVSREAGFRRQGRMARVREYFYGPRAELCPQSLVLSFHDLHLLRIGPHVPSASSASLLPLGSASALDPLKVPYPYP
jgi:polyribonucleotide 5'-hydroxyl-kinase